jgi:hypothetical protein
MAVPVHVSANVHKTAGSMGIGMVDEVAWGCLRAFFGVHPLHAIVWYRELR